MSDQKPIARRRPITAWVNGAPEPTGSAVFARYEAAGAGRRGAGFEHATNVGPVDANSNDIETVRQRSRYECRNNPFAAKAADVIVSQTVGGGIRPTIADPAVAKAWADFSRYSDGRGRRDFYGLQSLMLRGVVEGGEIIVRTRPRFVSDGFPIPLQVQLLEPEHLPVGRHALLGANVRDGIEFDAVEWPIAYHLYKQHPGDVSATGNSITTERVAAEDASGNLQVMHIFDDRRPGEIRGMPWLVRAIIALHDLYKYIDAEIVRKETASKFTAFIRTPALDANAAAEIFGTDGVADSTTEPTTYEIAPMGPGAMPVLPPGYDIQIADPAQSDSNMDTFMRVAFRTVSAAAGIPYELLTGDMSQAVTDRLFRANMLLSFQRKVREWQAIVVRQFCEPVWTQFLEAAVAVGRITRAQADESAHVAWIPEPLPHIHPVQERQADVLDLQEGLTTRTRICASRGTSFDDILEERAAEDVKIRAVALRFGSDAALLREMIDQDVRENAEGKP